MPKIRRLASLAAVSLALAACSRDSAGPTTLAGPSFAQAEVSAATASALLAQMDTANTALAAQGIPYRAAVAEYITPAGSGEIGATILQKDVGNKRLGHDFVPGDPRRADWSGAGPGDDITFAIDQTGDAVPPSTVVLPITAAQTTAAIRSATATWNGVNCAPIPLTENSSGGLDLGVYAYLVTGGARGGPAVVGDVQHTGWRDLNFAGGILGVTITFIFVDGGVPTDVDGNGRLDVAFREIYYDPSWIWDVGGVSLSTVDVESVALHESGHGLSQAHFGNIFLRHDGSFDASPRAVMNAFYQSPLRQLLGTDNAGHCDNWANWPGH